MQNNINKELSLNKKCQNIDKIIIFIKQKKKKRKKII